MAKKRNIVRLGKRLWMRGLLPLIGLSLLSVACNSETDDDTQTGYADPTDVAVTGFSLKANSKILSGLDTVFFSIDLERGLIYNPDSLPKGTKVTDLIPVITYSKYISTAVITMQGGEKRSGEVNYKKNPNDSIDFTGDVKLRLTSSAGNFRTYTLKVNVHEMNPDSLSWGKTAVSKLPSRTGEPKEQKTVNFKNKATTLIQEKDGTYTLSTTADPGAETWNVTRQIFDFTPRIRTLSVSAENLWILSTDGTLYKSADGMSWETTDKNWYNILGSYDNHLLGISRNGDTYSIESADGAIASTPLPAGFPIEDYSDIYSYQSQWMASPISVIFGGVTSAGTITSRVWAYDGDSWASLGEGKLPALRGATIVPYHTYRRAGTSWNYNLFDTMMLLGGIKEDGTLNHETYLSYDNGVTWIKASPMLQMPDFIPASWRADNIVIYKPMSAELLPGVWNEMPDRQIPGWYRINTSVSDGIITWDCPYIYMYGGCNSEGLLYNTIWRGVINRLTFTPII